MFAREPSIVAYVLAGVDLVVSLVATGHVLLFKRDTRAAIGWIGLIWLSPILGATLYLLLGINRIQRKARTPTAGPGSSHGCALMSEPRRSPRNDTRHRSLSPGWR